jgi:polygalacturonase
MMLRVGALALLLAGPVQAKTIRGDWLEISVGSGVFSVKSYGAQGNGKTDDTKAIQGALDAAAAAGGGTVDFPPGHYMTTAFSFSSSNTVINLPKGSTVTFDSDHSKYDKNGGALIEAYKLSNIGIIGGGTFDGQGASWWKAKDKVVRPHFFDAKHADHLLMKDCMFLNSPAHVLELYSDFTELSHVQVKSPLESANTDAVDVHGTPFYIHDCHFDTGDDNIAVHASHLLVENCHFGHGHGTSIGSCGSDDFIENVTFRNCDYTETTQAARIKTITGAKKTIIRDVTWDGLTLHNVQHSIIINMFYRGEKNTTTDVQISDITIKNVKAYGTKTDQGKTVSPGKIHCQESSPCTGIHLQNIQHIDSSEPWDCWNAFGDYSGVPGPEPCLQKGGPSPHPTPSPPSPTPSSRRRRKPTPSPPSPTPSSRRRRRRKQSRTMVV